MKTLVGTFRSAFSRKHPGWIFSFSLEWVDSGSERKGARQVFLQMPVGQILPPFQGWQCNLGYVLVGEVCSLLGMRISFLRT